MSETESTFDPTTGTLWFVCSLPPPDNHCHRSASGGGRYPAKEYKAWLERYAPELRALLGDWEPDRTRWWRVALRLLIGSKGDAPNYQKALLDLLSGSYVVEKAFVDAKERRIEKGRILKPGALWDDDKRVRTVALELDCIRHETPYAVLLAHPTDPPRDWKAEQETAAAAEREAARAAEIAGRTASYTASVWETLLTTLTGEANAAVRARIRKALKGGENADGYVPVTFSPKEWMQFTGGEE